MFKLLSPVYGYESHFARNSLSSKDERFFTRLVDDGLFLTIWFRM